MTDAQMPPDGFRESKPGEVDAFEPDRQQSFLEGLLSLTLKTTYNTIV
jgi:hypothetical protein